MTREEAIARIENHKILHKMNEPRAIYISEALDMAIKALDQEPCDDAVSREFMYKLGAKCIAARNENGVLVAISSIESLPSVTPQPNIAHWIEHEIEDAICWITCSRCNCETNKKFNYCPNCGRRMIEPQEDS